LGWLYLPVNRAARLGPQDGIGDQTALEQHPAGSEAVEVGRVGQPQQMAIGADGGGGVVIGEDEQDVRWRHSRPRDARNHHDQPRDPLAHSVTSLVGGPASKRLDALRSS